MKIRKILFTTIAAAMGAALCLSVSACNGTEHTQDLNYKESVQKINNPDQGFYRPIYVKITEDGVTYNKNIVTDATQLYHLRTDISAFSGAVNGSQDKPLTQAALEGLEELLSYLKSRDKNAIIRFAYDPAYGGAKDKEPAGEMILEHVKEVCPVLNDYGSTLTAIEAGFIGPWGEMHSSQIANAEHISPIIETFLTNTSSIPVLVRTPKMIYNYLGITLNDAPTYTVSDTSIAYRLGLFNDGYLGSNSDLGTYTDREKEIPFLSRQNERLPYGGEVVIPESPLHDIGTCLPEMNQLHLSYLNVEWNNNVIDKWKNSTYTKKCGSDSVYYGKTAFEYIENHMGYRFVLTKSVFDYPNGSDRFGFTLSLKNVGFGNLYNEKYAKLIFTDASGEVKREEKLDGAFTGGDIFSGSADLDLQNGSYDVYLCLYGDEADGVPLYCLQFANDGLWNATLKANKIGSIDVN